MDQETTREIWGILEADLRQLEQGPDVKKELFEHTQMAVGMLLQCDPAEVLRCLEESALPQRALASWLAYEGARMGLNDKANALKLQWQRHSREAGELIAPPRKPRGSVRSEWA